jgi:methyl-accepting chemotaxis protein
MRFSFSSAGAAATGIPGPGRLSRLSVKLPLFAAIGLAIAMASVAAVTIYIAASTLNHSTRENFRELSGYRANIIKGHFESQVNALQVMATAGGARIAMNAFEGAYEQLEGRGENDLVARYTTGNPINNARQDYNGDGDQTYYGTAHRRYHPVLRKAKIELGLYDIFLIRTDGTVIYTVEKESDFGTNLISGPHRDTGLGKAFRAALRDAAEQKVAFADFEAYGPSAGAPASFMARVILNEAREPVGVLAVQMSIKMVADLLYNPEIDSTDIMLVGPDGRLRSQLRSTKENTVLTRQVAGQHIKDALAGQVSIDYGLDADGQEALLAAYPLNVMGNQWALVVSRTTAMLNAPIRDKMMLIMSVTLGMLILMVLIAAVLARTMTRPIQRLSAAVDSLSRGESSEIPGLQRKDEIGELARSLQVVHTAGMDATRIRSSLDKANVNLLVADQSNRYVYASGAALKYFQTFASDIQKACPDFSPDSIVGCTREDMRKYLGIDLVKQTANGTGYTVRSTFGDRTIDLSAVPVLNDKNEYLGATVEWRDVTDELRTAMEVAGMVNAAAVGDFSQRLPIDGKSGPMKDICDGFNRVSETVELSIGAIGDSLQHLAQGDLTYRMQQKLIGSFEELQTHVQTTFERLTETMVTIQSTAEEVANAAAEINAGSNDLAKRTEQQATSLEETAATTEQLAASVKQTAESSRRATELAEDASNVAARGGTIASEAVDAIGRIEKASQQIAEIVGVIDDIAFQTNLLALNAAVEAARAGEAGKGFAVVASEVRTLAQRSGQAAKDIKGLIANSSEQVAGGVKLVHGAGEALHQIVDAASRVSATVSEISSATAEQANGIEEMSQTVAQLDEMTQQNSAMAEQSAAAADGLQQQIITLRTLVAAFKTGTATTSRTSGEPRLLQNLVSAAFAEKASETRHAVAPRPQRDDGWDTPAPAAKRRAGTAVAGNWSEF